MGMAKELTAGSWPTPALTLGSAVTLGLVNRKPVTGISEQPHPEWYHMDLLWTADILLPLPPIVGVSGAVGLESGQRPSKETP